MQEASQVRVGTNIA